MSFLELRIPPVLLALIVGGLMAGLSLAVPAAYLPVPWRVPISIGCCVLGAAIAIVGVLAFRRHRTTVNPLALDKSASLVSAGIYRVSRNPMYLGLLVALIGWGVYLANAAVLLWLPVFVLYMNRFQIRPEERSLSRLFGTEFDSYAKTVRRWI